MTQKTLIAPVELTDADLDAVAAGQNSQGGVGLVNVGLQIGSVTVSDILSHNQVTLTNFLNNNTVTVPIGVVVAALNGSVNALNRIGA